MWNPFKKSDPNVFIYNKDMQKADSYFSSVLNAVKTISRRMGAGGLFGVSPNGKRNYNEIFGYGEFLDYADYLAMYKRGGIAVVVVAKIPKSCWRDMPEIKVNDKNILEDQLMKLKKAKFFKAIERADILNRIGNFSVMLIGIPDGLELTEPVGSARKDSFDSMYFNVYSYDGIEIIKTDRDPASPRFGLPVIYQLQTLDTDGSKRKQTQIVSVNVPLYKGRSSG